MILILNQFLPRKKLESTLSKEEFSNLEFILKNMSTKEQKIQSIFTELELLGGIHHSVNLQEYLKKEFRMELFQCSKSSITVTWNKYFKECGIIKNISEMTDDELLENLKKFVKFDWGNNEETKRFVSFFNYPEYIIPNESSDTPLVETICGKCANFSPLKMLFDYQTPIVSKTLKHVKKLNARCLIQMPTGTGKTRTAIEILAHILNQNTNLQIIWFANKSELLEQARESFIHVWNHVGKYPISVIAAWGSKDLPKFAKENVIIFAGYQKMNNFLREKENLKPHYIIVDEAHQILAPTYNHALNNLANFENSTRIIGLTATPGRGINEIQNKSLVQEFHGNIIQIELDEDEENREYTKNIIRYLEDQDILSKVMPEPLFTDFEYKLSEEEWQELAHLINGDRPEYKEMLIKLANDNVRNMLIIEKLKNYAEQGKKILYFSTSKSQSVVVSTALQQLKVKAVHVGSETQRSFRKQIIKKFIESDEVNVICNYDIFSTGFDVPKLDVVFIGRPVNSPVLFNQIVGRGTRGLKMGSSSDSFTLVQVIDRIHSRFADFDPYEQYGFWDANWKND